MAIPLLCRQRVTLMERTALSECLSYKRVAKKKSQQKYAYLIKSSVMKSKHEESIRQNFLHLFLITMFCSQPLQWNEIYGLL